MKKVISILIPIIISLAFSGAILFIVYVGGKGDNAKRASNPDAVVIDMEADDDGDGLSNADEILLYGTNIYSFDTDEDGLSDYDEIHEYGTDPTKADTDQDGLTDGEEIERGLNPLLQSTYNDGVIDSER